MIWERSYVALKVSTVSLHPKPTVKGRRVLPGWSVINRCNRIQLHIDFTQQAEKPLSFTIDNPARIAFDFSNTVSQLEKRKLPIGLGIAQSITTVSAKEKTRVILNLTETVPYQVSTNNNRVSIILDSESTGTAVASKFADTQGRFSSGEKAVSKIDFRRGEKAKAVS